MIDRRELIDTASRLSLNPHVVEKDYVLGWMLAGIRAHHDLAEKWVFKGGTCLKKCFFETYRFSEDLDFTLRDASHLDEEFLKRTFSKIGDWVYEESGIQIPADMQTFEIFQNPRGNPACQGRIAYRGPVSPMGRNAPRIKLDLTADERIVLPPVAAPVFHPYSDAPEAGIEVLAYAYEEAFGEKVRALGERTRPRDLYDVINLYRNTSARPGAAVLLDVIRQKCEFKGIGVPSFADLEPHHADLEAGWENMLAHQLPALPPLDAFWNELPAFFAWLEGGQIPAEPVAYPRSAGDMILRDRRLNLGVGAATQSAIEVVRFAASNRLCVELDYRNEQGVASTRIAEPYSLRRTSEGNILLHVYDYKRNADISFRVDRIRAARVTNKSFTPRHEIELTPEGPIHIQPTERRAISPLNPYRPAQTRQTSNRKGPTYVYECPVCGKRFKRGRMGNHLNPHKDKGGYYNCPGRTGYLVDTRY